jgi:parvulin-like peptidyl-prolyl isomerase
MKINICNGRSDFPRNTHSNEWRFCSISPRNICLVPSLIRNFASLRPWPTKLKGEMGRPVRHSVGVRDGGGSLLGVRFFGRCLLAAGWLAAASEAYAAGDVGSSDANVIARVGDTEVKLDEIRSTIESLDAKDQTALARDPSLLNQTVRTLLMRRVVLKEALAKHWDTEPAVATLIQRARDNTVVESFLQSVSKPPDSYPSEAELQAAYDARKSQLLVPKQFRIGQIFVALPKNADKASTEKAQTKLETIKKSLHQSGADFATVAKSNSDEPESAARGGELGWLSESQIQPEVRSQLGTLTKNSISEPIKLDDGWHILKVIDIKEPYTPTLEEIRSALAQQLRNEKTQANSQAYLGKLLQQTPVAINELALSKVLNKSEK